MPALSVNRYTFIIKNINVKTIITSTGDSVKDKFDLRYGRGAYFCVFDEESGDIEILKNENADAGNGAGTKAAEKAIELGVTKIISGDFGPKAKELLEKFDIQMVIIQDNNLTIEEIISKLQSGN